MLTNIEHVDPYRLYVLYNVLRLHFTTVSYDIRKYGTSAKKFTRDTFEKDNFAKVYYAMSKHIVDDKHATEVIASNLVRDPQIRPIDIDVDRSKTLRKFNRNKVALLDAIKYDLGSKSLLTSIKNGDIIREVVSGKFDIETIAFLARIIPLKELIDSSSRDPYMWKVLRSKIDKYEPFCTLESNQQRLELKETIVAYITDITEETPNEHVRT